MKHISDNIFPPLLGEDQGGVCQKAGNTRIYTRETLRRTKALRKNPTDAEKKLWYFLRNRQLENCKFRRQYFIGKYITDFVCIEQKLVIEVDGGQHAKGNYDKNRDQFITSEGYTVLRFWNNDVLENIEGIVEIIRSHLLTQTPPQPSPKRGGSISAEGLL